jgi:hypothetical protein
MFPRIPFNVVVDSARSDDGHVLAFGAQRHEVVKHFPNPKISSYRQCSAPSAHVCMCGHTYASQYTCACLELQHVCMYLAA